MKTKKPSEMSIEELLKMQKTIQSTIKILILVAIILFILILLLFLKKGFLILILFPFVMAFLMISHSNSLEEIEQEITSRDLE
ncbi:hypothetical protein [Flavobacterium tistrianum]|uniref:hypothetical protein n=1 Tax=Flavobacterium tistrianum TaxID=1685414 RepID=UPI000DAD33D2|nr:hypothetical protein [Flavobacterium tistrianum]KAF2341932.1 hypothetical protein DMB71_06755 [Flavobacterium tistrianum]